MGDRRRVESGRIRAGLILALSGLAAVALVLVASMTFRPPATPEAAADVHSPTPVASPAPTPSPSASPVPSPPAIAPVTIAFGGDVHFESFLRAPLLADPQSLLAPTRALFDGADFAVVNLETAVTESTRGWPKTYNFRAPVEAYEALLVAGVDAVSLANNHSLDYYEEGFVDTLRAAEAAGISVIGGGDDETAAYSPLTVELGGRRIAFLAAAEVLTDPRWIARDASSDEPARAGIAGAKAEQLDRLTQAIGEADRDHDLVVIYLHWGEEGNNCPIDRQTSLAPALVEAGADVVVGTHAHRLQGYGFHGGSFVHWGLGNFVWYTRGGEGARSETGVMHLTFHPDGTLEPNWRPGVIRDGVPHALEGPQGDAAVSRMAGYIACGGLAPAAVR